MILAPIPANDEMRLAELYRFDVLDSGSEQEYDDLALLAAQICGCSMGTITLIDKDRQWFKSRVNVEATQGSREHSFCAHAIMYNDIFMVPDSKKDERFYDNPDVTGGLMIRFYAGAPIVSSTGYMMGTICAMDKVPKHAFNEQQVNALKIIAGQVSKLLDLRMSNKKLAQQSDALVKAEKQLTRLNVQRHEDENRFIATELHENFAQILAAVKMQLELAAGSKDEWPAYIEKSKRLINDLVEAMKQLSRSITPTTFDNANFTDLIEAHITAFSMEHGIAIEFSKEKLSARLSGKKGLSLFRITELYLKMALQNRAQEIVIDLKGSKEISFTLFDNGFTGNSDENGTNTYLQDIQTRVELLNGKTRLHRDAEEGNIIQVLFPFED
jgi:signal transduction histidine kinase